VLLCAQAEKENAYDDGGGAWRRVYALCGNVLFFCA
jgi:hypothetical protein